MKESIRLLSNAGINIMVLYHLTQEYYGDYWKPDLVKMHASEYEYVNHARICMSPTIEQCLIALNYTKGNGEIPYYVYSQDIPGSKLILNDYLNKKHWIFDSHITHETWLVKPVTLLFLGKILVDNSECYDKYFYPLRQVLDSNTKKWNKDSRFKLIKPKYKWIDKANNLNFFSSYDWVIILNTLDLYD